MTAIPEKTAGLKVSVPIKNITDFIGQLPIEVKQEILDFLKEELDQVKPQSKEELEKGGFKMPKITPEMTEKDWEDWEDWENSEDGDKMTDKELNKALEKMS